MTRNEQAARKFAAQFSPPLQVVKTLHIDGQKTPGAFVVATYNESRGIGVSAFFYKGGVRAFIEAVGKGEIAESAGKVIATALGMFNERDNGGRDQKRTPRRLKAGK